MIMRNIKQIALLMTAVGLLCAGCGTETSSRTASANAAAVRPAGSTTAETAGKAEEKQSESRSGSQKRGNAMSPEERQKKYGWKDAQGHFTIPEGAHVTPDGVVIDKYGVAIGTTPDQKIDPNAVG